MKVTLDIDDPLYDKISSKSKSLGFDKVEDYITYLISEKTKQDKADEEKIAKKLEDLGYM